MKKESEQSDYGELSKFKLSGKDFGAFHVAPTIPSVIAYLERLPFRELKTTAEVCKEAKLGGDALNKHACAEPLQPYRMKYGYNKTVWGSRRTITELKKVLADEK